MLIFGTYVIHRTLGEGHFACPQCMRRTAYRLRRGRWFFHVLFIPLIPMKRTPAFVECQSCKSKFALGVLPVAELEQYRGVLDDQFPAGIPGGGIPGGPVGTGAAGAAGAVGAAPAADLLPTLPPPPGTRGAPTSGAATDPYAPLGGEPLAYVRALASGVLTRAGVVTDAGLAAGVALTRRVGVHDYTAAHLRHDVETLDTSYLPGLIRDRVAAGTLQQPQARGLVNDALAVARANGDLVPAQWDWIVLRALDAGLGPTAATEIRESVPFAG